MTWSEVLIMQLGVRDEVSINDGRLTIGMDLGTDDAEVFFSTSVKGISPESGAGQEILSAIRAELKL